MKNEILSYLPQGFPWSRDLTWYDSIDSTNLQAKKRAVEGAPHGSVLIAGQQTQGRGRLGRSFHSPAGSGLYLSVILRPNCKPEALMHLTCAAGVAACNAIFSTSGLQPGIKWINDLVAGERKLGGILTELSCDPKTGLVDYAIIGIGINCLQEAADFPEEIRSIATSLRLVSGQNISPALLAAALIRELAQAMETPKAEIMRHYRQSCVTLGKQIRLVRGDEIRTGTALDLDENGGLLVAFDDGSRQIVQSGEVSIRGMYGYC